MSDYSLIIDGLNCAELVRDQMERTLAGNIVAINHTIIRPWYNLEESLIELEQKLEIIEQMSDLAIIACSTGDIQRAREEGKVAIILGTQNSTLIENDLTLLGLLKRLGFRILQPTYNEENRFGSGATQEEDKGLTEEGRQWVDAMNRAGLVIDLSHSGEKTSADAIAVSTDPVIVSHANCIALCDSPRNKSDAFIKLVADNDGVIGAVLWAPILRHDQRPTLDDYFNHVEHMVNIAGVDHVSFATDTTEGNIYASREEWSQKFGPDGVYPTVTGVLGDWFTYDTRLTDGYETLAATPHVWDGLVKRGFNEDDVEKIMGGNLLRIFNKVWNDK